MTNKKIIYINTFAWGTAHEIFNASVLYMCAMLTGALTCRTSRSNYQAICNTLSKQLPENILFKPTPTIGGGGKYALLARYIIGAILDFFYILFSSKCDIIVMPFNNLFGLKTINWLNKLLHRRILICCHGEMEAIASDVNRKGLLSKILHNRCKRFFLSEKLKISEGLYFSVLGDSVKENLGQYIDKDKMNHFVALDHPYVFPQNCVQHCQTNGLLKIGTAGAMSESKGLNELIKYAEICKNRELKVALSHTGRIVGFNQNDLANYVDLPAQSGELSREDYDTRLTKLDYMLFFYNTSAYKITASGAIMDALALGKPIIALRNDYFEYLFRKFGRFGYLADNIEQMVEITERILSGEMDEKFDFESIKSRFTPQALQSKFQSVMDNIYSKI